jgi:arylsulfatase A-like enzyme
MNFSNNFTALITTACTAATLTSRTESSKPNIVMIMADDLGYGDISCYGGTLANTPNLDKLAEEGVRFTDFHSNGPVCSPTRAALFTGLYQQRTGITSVINASNNRDHGMPTDIPTMPQAMKKLGYSTALFGKWHLGIPERFNPSRRGFDTFKGFLAGNIDYHNHLDREGNLDWHQQTELKDEKGYITELMTKHALNYIDQNKDTPFLLAIMHGAPHLPYQGPTDKGLRLANTPFNKQPKNLPDRDTKQIYKEMIESMDKEIGKVVARLDRHNLRRNTLIVFCADNGQTGPGSSGGLKGKKSSINEGGHRVAGIFNWPGKLKPQLCKSTAMTMDLMPTFLDMAGADSLENYKLDGISLLPLLTQSLPLPKRYTFWEYKGKKAMRDGNWKLITSGKKTELYDLDKDLGEKHNLAGQYPEKVQSMSKIINEWYAEVSPKTNSRKKSKKAKK